jgi:hypothetical protein
MEWEALEPSGNIDAGLRLVMIMVLFGWNVLESLSLRTPYPLTMVALWDSRIWRLVLLITVWLGAEWCPRVGLLSALALVMYVANMIQVG